MSARPIPAAAILEIAEALDIAIERASYRGAAPDDVTWTRLIRARAIVRVHLVERLEPLEIVVAQEVR